MLFGTEDPDGKAGSGYARPPFSQAEPSGFSIREHLPALRVELVHGDPDSSLEKEVQSIDRSRHPNIQKSFLRGGKGRQHVVDHRFAALARPSHTKAQTGEIRGLKRVDDAPDSPMASGPATRTKSQTPNGEIQIIVNDDQVAGSVDRGESFERLGNGLPRGVHEGLGLQARDGAALELSTAESAREAIFIEGYAMAPREGLHDAKTDIVPGAHVTGTRVPEPSNNAKGRKSQSSLASEPSAASSAASPSAASSPSTGAASSA